ncbi:hypothetical protein [Streptomyces canus]|uniref:hypothetical protein n=1 Tax=Streptomyces canus TaxID=58343 RepID=UPI002DD7C03E|nr:hypothetical protein [Streptomyces canus]WSD86343.1 hypothetical protein OG925_19455 [Streptomyces canus]
MAVATGKADRERQTGADSRLHPLARGVSGLVALSALIVACFATFKSNNDIGTAALFLVAIAFGVAAIGGTLPASLKVGNVDLVMKAKEQGVIEGAAQGVSVIARQLETGDLDAEKFAQLLPPSVRETVRPMIETDLDDLRRSQDAKRAEEIGRATRATASYAKDAAIGREDQDQVVDRLTKRLSNDEVRRVEPTIRSSLSVVGEAAKENPIFRRRVEAGSLPDI